jgi:predicted ATP-grasp superfamily ATP-dependent carboligase
MRLLVTTTRMPTAVEEIRKLGRNGHVVHAADTFREAPGSHSRYVAQRHVVASPRHETSAFLAQIGDIVRAHRIDLVLPMFEEVFYLQRHCDELGPGVNVFAPSLQTLRRLHDKVSFVELAEQIGVDVPRTLVAEDADELRGAIEHFPRYFARPAYSRGGLLLLTNTGPLAGVLPIESCRPTPENPWLVQEFVSGVDVCTFSVARHGRITAHATYVHPKTIDSAGGIVFESIVDPQTLEIARRIVEATDYHGQISLDFMRTERGLVAIECNPRPTAGVSVMPDEMLLRALFGEVTDGPALVAPAGARRHIWSALLRDMWLHRSEIPSDVDEMMSGAEDLFSAHGDRWPGLWQFLSLAHVRRYRRSRDPGKRTRSDLMSAYFADVSWDGDASASPRSDARILGQHAAQAQE